jgi:chromosome segregation ATPase
MVDLMACERCSITFPSIRGRKKYTLVPPEKLSSLMAELEEARRQNSETLSRLKLMERRSHGLEAEIEEFKLQSEISSMERRVGTLESENKGLELRRAKLREAIELMASGISAPARPRMDEALPVREPF